MNHLILRVAVKLLFAPIILFAFYVQFHGDFGPGGGFQAGVIFAVAFILHAFCFGLEETKKILPQRTLKWMMVIGFLFYAGTGLVTMLLGQNLLGYAALDPHSPTHGQHYGIMLVEWGVGTAVASTMLTIFYHFSGREPDIDPEDW
ncbi:MAG: Na(+)/H(+) antiporter subunit B [Parvularculaceae bacterium]